MNDAVRCTREKKRRQIVRRTSATRAVHLTQDASFDADAVPEEHWNSHCPAAKQALAFPPSWVQVMVALRASAQLSLHSCASCRRLYSPSSAPREAIRHRPGSPSCEENVSHAAPPPLAECLAGDVGACKVRTRMCRMPWSAHPSEYERRSNGRVSDDAAPRSPPIECRLW